MPRAPTRFGGGEAGRERTLAMNVLFAFAPGVPVLYQGEELGLEDGLVAPESKLDPVGPDGDVAAGRDGCRTADAVAAGAVQRLLGGPPVAGQRAATRRAHCRSTGERRDLAAAQLPATAAGSAATVRSGRLGRRGGAVGARRRRSSHRAAPRTGSGSSQHRRRRGRGASPHRQRADLCDTGCGPRRACLAASRVELGAPQCHRLPPELGGCVRHATVILRDSRRATHAR